MLRGVGREVVDGPDRPRLGHLEAGGDDRDLDHLLHGRVDDRAEDDVGLRVGQAVDELRGLGDLVQGDVLAARDVDEDAVGALDRGVDEERAGDGLLGGFDGPVLAGGDARVPMKAMPMPFMMDLTSAKSRLIRPGLVMRSEMPWAAWRRMSSAILKASWMDVSRFDGLEEPLVGDGDHRVHDVLELLQAPPRPAWP